MTYLEQPIAHYSWVNNEHCIAGFSTRKGGASSGVYASMNTGLHSADNHALVLQNRATFFNALAPQCTIANLRQIHSADIVRVDSSFVNDTEADGFFTTEKGVILSISIADCGSVLFHDKHFSLVAALHCGWRGTRDGIIQNMLVQLSKFVDPSELTAYIGPMIAQENYEVSDEFLYYFPKEFLAMQNGSLHLDLNGCVEEILQTQGVGTIHNAKLDTYANPEQFFPYRRDGQTGRMCSFIALK